MTAHHRLLDRFAAQIPPDAALSVTTDLYPHLDHRELIYQFPILGDAQWALVDVSGTTDQHPADIQAAIRKMMAAGWGVVDAADGYILLAQGRGEAEIPDDFYDFARISPGGAAATSAARPQYPLDVTFGDKLRLIGYDVVDNAKWRRTNFRFYWEVLKPLPADTAISMQVVTPDGETADDTVQRPMPALVWYPPANWRPGETIVTTSMPWYLPRAWAPVLTVTAGGERALAKVDQPVLLRPPTDRPATCLHRWSAAITGLGAFARDGCGPMPARRIRESRRRPASKTRTGGLR